MAVAVTLRQRERFLKPPKPTKGLTPLEATAATYGGQSPTAPPPPTPTEPPNYIHDPADLAPVTGMMGGCNADCEPGCLKHNLRYRREWLYAQTVGTRFWWWMRDLARDHKIPLDNCLADIDFFSAYAEAFLVAAATWPELAEVQWPEIFDSPPTDDEIPEPEYWAPRTETDALAAGLTVRRKRRKRPTLPGCHGAKPDGSACEALRFFGHKFCPAHEKEYKDSCRP